VLGVYGCLVGVGSVGFGDFWLGGVGCICDWGVW
jgi:hypothetical protein